MPEDRDREAAASPLPRPGATAGGNGGGAPFPGAASTPAQGRHGSAQADANAPAPGWADARQSAGGGPGAVAEAHPEPPPPAAPTIPGATVLPIVLHPDTRLRLVSRGLPDDPAALARDMLATMYAAPGRGLAAIQVGLPYRMFVIDPFWKDAAAAPLVALDPEILDPSGETATATEGCLSIPGHPVDVTRPAAITLRWTDLAGNRREARLEGIAAICAQHEYDHLEGVLILDHERTA